MQTFFQRFKENESLESSLCVFSYKIFFVIYYVKINCNLSHVMLRRIEEKMGIQGCHITVKNVYTK